VKNKICLYNIWRYVYKQSWQTTYSGMTCNTKTDTMECWYSCVTCTKLWCCVVELLWRPLERVWFHHRPGQLYRHYIHGGQCKYSSRTLRRNSLRGSHLLMTCICGHLTRLQFSVKKTLLAALVFSFLHYTKLTIQYCIVNIKWNSDISSLYYIFFLTIPADLFWLFFLFF
jgi:hypothetical protein